MKSSGINTWAFCFKDLILENIFQYKCEAR